MKWHEKFWNNELSNIAKHVQNEVKQVFEHRQNELVISKKSDDTLVTEIDYYVSNLIKQRVEDQGGSDVCFYSEEDSSDLTFPAIIVDPIDGMCDFNLVGGPRLRLVVQEDAVNAA